jgi:hypothetical protein
LCAFGLRGVASIMRRKSDSDSAHSARAVRIMPRLQSALAYFGSLRIASR